MTWHSEWERLGLISKDLAARALSLEETEPEKARELYSQAARNSECALAEVPKDLFRAVGELAVSSAALYVKGEEYASALRVVRRYETRLVFPNDIRDMFMLGRSLEQLESEGVF